MSGYFCWTGRLINQDIDYIECGIVLLIIQQILLPEGGDGQSGTLGDAVRLQDMEM